MKNQKFKIDSEDLHAFKINFDLTRVHHIVFSPKIFSNKTKTLLSQFSYYERKTDILYYSRLLNILNISMY